MKFVSWDNRPALLDRAAGVALAVLAPGEDWSVVDFWDVCETGAVLNEDVWRARFEGWVPPIPVGPGAAGTTH